MTTQRAAAQQLALIAWATKRLKTLKERIEPTMDVRFAEESLHASVRVGGQDVVVAKCTRVQTKPKLKASDPIRFAEWVGQRWPTEIVPTVAPAFLEVLQARMENNPAGVLIDDDGEVCEHAALDQADPYTRTSLARDADITLSGLLEKRSIADLVRFIADPTTDLDEAEA